MKGSVKVVKTSFDKVSKIAKKVYKKGWKIGSYSFCEDGGVLDRFDFDNDFYIYRTTHSKVAYVDIISSKRWRVEVYGKDNLDSMVQLFNSINKGAEITISVDSDEEEENESWGY